MQRFNFILDAFSFESKRHFVSQLTYRISWMLLAMPILPLSLDPVRTSAHETRERSSAGYDRGFKALAAQ